MNTQSGSGSSQTYQAPQLSPYQLQEMANTTGLNNQASPILGQTLQAGSDIFNAGVGGVGNAANAVAGYGNQAGGLLGQTGASNLQTGSQGLQNLFSPEYAQQQVAASAIPAQLQYQQNLAGQQANFGGAGNLGSARQAIAGGALAQQNQMQQQQAMAQTQAGIEANRANAANSLMGGGASQLAGGLGQFQAGLGAAGAQTDLFGKYAPVMNQLFAGTKGNYGGTAGGTTTTNSGTGQSGVSLLPGLSDRNAKKNIEYVGKQNGHDIYDFDYREYPGRWRGVMAQDVQKLDPAAVYTGPTGYLHVNYDRIGVSMQKVA